MPVISTENLWSHHNGALMKHCLCNKVTKCIVKQLSLLLQLQLLYQIATLNGYIIIITCTTYHTLYNLLHAFMLKQLIFFYTVASILATVQKNISYLRCCVHMNFSEDAEPPLKNPPKWKNCCAAILTQKVAKQQYNYVAH